MESKCLFDIPIYEYLPDCGHAGQRRWVGFLPGGWYNFCSLRNCHDVVL